MKESKAPTRSPADIAEFYCWIAPVDGVEAPKRELADDFPGWSIIHTDRGRWWAIRLPVMNRSTGWPATFDVSEVEADTAELLREKLTEAMN
ncbi:hypothetical protein GCM10010191_00810 [Actinomadura vinacea]|uniref:Uncharacterized protein n=1 Tax=Actinomadura vinacea TaxID=115336 RepID=A0ABN3I8V9_9ACTN